MSGDPGRGRPGATAPPTAAYLGVPVIRRGIVGSTNDEALLRAAEGAPEGLVVVAEEQTAGRGRLGRSWWDQPGDSLLFSLVLRPAIAPARYPLFGIAMAAAVAEAGEEATGTALDVKWPNDVLWDGRKLCGILAESRAGQAERPALVIGAGINVNQGAEAFPPEIRDRATSLRAAAGGRRVDRDALLASVLGRFDRYRLEARDRGADSLREALAARLPRAGTPVRVAVGDRIVAGTVEGVTETGALRVREPKEGALVTVSAGELT
ncbi:MAG TPA: biotin--[acetyl-CoA-carboxylase] ligase [Candidatus Eisenbacteria bacterium]